MTLKQEQNKNRKKSDPKKNEKRIESKPISNNIKLINKARKTNKK